MWYFCMRNSGNLTLKSSKHVIIFSRCLYNHIQFFFFRFLGLTKMQVNVIFRKLSTSMDHNRSSMFICFNVTVKCLKCICFIIQFLDKSMQGTYFSATVWSETLFLFDTSLAGFHSNTILIRIKRMVHKRNFLKSTMVLWHTFVIPQCLCTLLYANAFLLHI